MIEPVRQEMLQLLAQLSEVAPEIRFGQLVANLAFMAAGPFDRVLWDLEDDQLVPAMRQLLADLKARSHEVA